MLGALVSWIERADVHANVILDDLPSVEDRSVLDGLALLVERVGDRVRLIVSGRGEPALPLAGWRSRGWVTHVGEADLSFSDADACDLARSMRSPLDDAEVAALNRTVEGWPLGLHLGLLAATEPTDVPGGLHRRVRDHVVVGVVDRLPEHQRHVAYALSVPAAFDLELSRLLLGDESVPVVRELLRLGIFLRIDDERPGVMRYHGLVRTVLEHELREREPVWHEQLVRRAASISVERGDLAAAHAHLVSIGDDGAAMRLVVSRAFSFVDRGDAEAIGRLALVFPPRSDVADPSFAAATPLTAREQSLLEFLPSHLSYAQIAARTFLSVNTVKSNLKSIYRKLGVASRADAVELARQAGLIRVERTVQDVVVRARADPELPSLSDSP